MRRAQAALPDRLQHELAFHALGQGGQAGGLAGIARTQHHDEQGDAEVAALAQAEKPQTGGTLNIGMVYVTLSPLSWDPADWNYKTAQDAGLYYDRLFVADFAEDLTPPEEYTEPREPLFLPPVLRDQGTGRPTKRDRRLIERAWDDRWGAGID